MKTQIVNQAASQLLCNNNRFGTTTQLRRFMILAVTLSALLLAGRIAVQAQSPPTTYDALSDGFGFPGDPATTANSQTPTLGWSFTSTLPAAYAYQSRDNGCQICLVEYYWSYDYHPGGSFMLSNGTDTFLGTFTSGYGAGYSEDGGPDVEHLTLDMYFTGQWDGNGKKEAGLMVLDEGGEYPFVDGTATLSFAPAPEPGSILLLGSGILGLAGILRRRLLR
jgi:PEP-CTERM motif